MSSSRRPLILASQSPRRRALLKAAGYRFRVQPSRSDESSNEKRPERLVQELALRKAAAVAGRLKQGVVVGADTVVVLDGQILGKPADVQDAYRMLYRQSGSLQRVFTGIAVVDAENGRSKTAYAVSSVKMKKLPIEALLRLARKNLDKAGGYAIQSKRDPIAKVVRGDYDNVVGLPVNLVRKLLKPFLA